MVCLTYFYITTPLCDTVLKIRKGNRRHSIVFLKIVSVYLKMVCRIFALDDEKRIGGARKPDSKIFRALKSNFTSVGLIIYYEYFIIIKVLSQNHTIK